MQKNAFTLLEILVVIIIIAIISAILLSVLILSRRKSYQSSCQSNLRQINQALQIYISDYDDVYPPMDLVVSKEFPEVLRLSELRCPMSPSSPEGRHTKIDSYAFNGHLMTIIGVGVNRVFRSSEIIYPSTTVTFAEVTPPERILQAPDPFKYKKPYPYGQIRGWERHGGGANYVFCDGHVKWHTENQVDCSPPDTNNGSRPSFGVGEN
jgi:prepilin-type processing-associated H-X9-DG protein/prepilin-type N-terminal cleavage/methylation domain-containing protein